MNDSYQSKDKSKKRILLLMTVILMILIIIKVRKMKNVTGEETILKKMIMKRKMDRM